MVRLAAHESLMDLDRIAFIQRIEVDVTEGHISRAMI